MPRVVKKARVTKAKVKVAPVVPEVASVLPVKFVQKNKVYFLLALVVILVGVYLWKNKSLVVIAMVNGQPISRLELEKRLASRYGSQTTDEIINEQLILQAGQKKGIVVTDKEVADKISEVEKSLGGKITLKDALAGQGLSVDEFTWQIRLQLTLEKLVASDFAVTEKEIDDYLVANKSTMAATDEAGLRAEAKLALVSQKKNDSLRTLFTDLKTQAKIVKYL